MASSLFLTARKTEGVGVPAKRQKKQDFLTLNSHHQLKQAEMAMRIGPGDQRPDSFEKALGKGRSHFTYKNKTTISDSGPDAFEQLKTLGKK